MELAAYTVDEGSGNAEVCVVSSPQLDKIVAVELRTEDDSAQSESCDVVSIIIILNSLHSYDLTIVAVVNTCACGCAGGTDYTSVTQTLTLSLGAQRECVSVPLQDDSLVENDKTFDVILSTTEERVTLARDRAEVTIRNDDSEFLPDTFLTVY